MTPVKDAITLLTEDHEDVLSMLEEFETMRDGLRLHKLKLVQAICKSVRIHSQLERDLLFPKLQESMVDARLVEDALEAHTKTDALVAQLCDTDPDDECYDAKVHALAERLHQHIKHQEATMFPEVRQLEIDLQGLSSRLMEQRFKLERPPARNAAVVAITRHPKFGVVPLC
jgi:hypothetical protein